MKIAKSTQQRVVALFVLVCLMLLPDLIISVLHVVLDEDWRSTDQVTMVGTMDVRRPSYMLAEGEEPRLHSLSGFNSSYAAPPLLMSRRLLPSRRSI